MKTIENTPTVVFIATLDSANFSFTALGYDQKSARRALRDGLVVHSAEMGIPDGWWDKDDIHIQPLEMGTCVRDDGTILSNAAPTIDEVTERVKSVIRDAFAAGKLPDTIAATVDIYYYDDSIPFDAALKDPILRQKLLDFYTRTAPADAMQSPEDRVSEFEYRVYRNVNDWLSSQPFLGLRIEDDAPLAESPPIR